MFYKFSLIFLAPKVLRYRIKKIFAVILKKTLKMFQNEKLTKEALL